MGKFSRSPVLAGAHVAPAGGSRARERDGMRRDGTRRAGTRRAPSRRMGWAGIVSHLRRGTGRVSLAAATHRSPAEVNPRTLGL